VVSPPDNSGARDRARAPRGYQRAPHLRLIVGCALASIVLAALTLWVGFDLRPLGSLPQISNTQQDQSGGTDQSGGNDGSGGGDQSGGGTLVKPGLAQAPADPISGTTRGTQ
jgi:hypothetical protein